MSIQESEKPSASSYQAEVLHMSGSRSRNKMHNKKKKSIRMRLQRGTEWQEREGRQRQCSENVV